MRISIDRALEITATFERVQKKYPLRDLKRPWIDSKFLYKDLDFSRLIAPFGDGNWLPVDIIGMAILMPLQHVLTMKTIWKVIAQFVFSLDSQMDYSSPKR